MPHLILDVSDLTVKLRVAATVDTDGWSGCELEALTLPRCVLPRYLAVHGVLDLYALRQHRRAEIHDGVCHGLTTRLTHRPTRASKVTEGIGTIRDAHQCTNVPVARLTAQAMASRTNRMPNSHASSRLIVRNIVDWALRCLLRAVLSSQSR